MSYVIVPAKRCYSDVDDSASVPLPKPFCPTHPYTMLEYLVEEVLPRKCSSPETKRYYQSQLDDPKATIDECKSLLAGWVVELWEKKELRSVAQYGYNPLHLHFTTLEPFLFTSSCCIFCSFSVLSSSLHLACSLLFTTCKFD
jgi:hypothetical protein